ncbi:hypothetical protein M6B38_326645 [Iris pallida]|uniref:Uncharacterized protein n=2 Tax=Iris pallida TaxID=29817 RepID=A0AAX6H6P5_IRIPA|nr:hypothetical protein M6B38_326645 [Iris pallida]
MYAWPTTSSSSTAMSRMFETRARLRAEMNEMRKSFDTERVEMNKRLEESLAATTRIEKIFQILMEQSAYRGNNIPLE